MLYCYLDDNFLKFDPDEIQDDVFIFGGFVIDSSRLLSLRFEFAKLKAAYGISLELPIKYNLRDENIKEAFRTANESNALEEVISASDELRRGALELLAVHKAVVICSATYGYRDVATKKKVFYQWSFQNTLQRIGMMVLGKETEITLSEGSASVFVIVDWPPNQLTDRSLFRLYERGYYYGRGQTQTSKYLCGPLRKLGFYTTPFFSSAYHDPMLQLSDITVGAIKDFLNSCLNEKKVECKRTSDLFMPIVVTLFRKVNGEILKYGLVLAPKMLELKVQERFLSYSKAYIKAV
jgi:hypothetical protein